MEEVTKRMLTRRACVMAGDKTVGLRWFDEKDVSVVVGSSSPLFFGISSHLTIFPAFVLIIKRLAKKRRRRAVGG